MKIKDFYKENNIDIHFIDEKNLMYNNEEENKKIIEFLERNGPIDNEYKLFDEEEIKILENIPEKIEIEEKKEDNKENNEEEKDVKSLAKEENNNSKEILNENKDDIEEKSNLNYKKMSNLEESKDIEADKIQQKIDEIKERERTLLDQKSEILRRYLSENVIPLLSKGILDICQNMPEDPVESLAKYLSENEINKEKENKNKNEIENEIIKTINQSLSY